MNYINVKHLVRLYDDEHLRFKQQSTILAFSVQREVHLIGSSRWKGSDFIDQCWWPEGRAGRLSLTRVILRWILSPIINIDNRREGHIISPILVIGGQWILLFVHSPVWWPVMTRNSSTLSSSGGGVAYLSRIIRIDDTRSKVPLLSSALMSED